MTKTTSTRYVRKISRLIPATLSVICLIAATIASGEDLPSQTAQTAGFEQFSILLERNIFNPNRKGPSAPRIVREEAPKIDQFTLIGTMIDDADAFAFFEGTESAFNAVCQIGGVIAGQKVEEIRSDGITLIVNEQPVQIAVGKGMMRQEKGAWALTSEIHYARKRAPSPPASQEARIVSNDNASPPQTESSSTNDILKKLMEKRRQELNQ
ncbi:MAG: hypothetical protein JXR73_08005 [Candidatus Omnitrophica bacterium]|nr:hypothetical protein [Candidatus Omnitrophota bacterium]